MIQLHCVAAVTDEIHVARPRAGVAMEQYMLAQRVHFILQPAARHRQTSCALPEPNPGVRTARGKIMSTFRRATMRRSTCSREFKFEEGIGSASGRQRVCTDM